jgi:hypothetical protein
MGVPSPRLLLAALALSAALTGCGKSMQLTGGGDPSAGDTAGQGGVGLATKNTTRLGGADPAIDAAAVARAVYPGLTAATRPQAVVLVDEHDWPASLAASALAGAPLGAPLLYADGAALPEATVQALQAIRPVGAPALGGAQVIDVGASTSVPDGYRTRTVLPAAHPSTAAVPEPASVAAALEQLLALAQGGAPRQVIILSVESPSALQMPAAGLSAESGAPILFVTAQSVPTATATALKSLHRPAIYVLGAAAVDTGTLAELARFGAVTQIAGGSATAASGPGGPASGGAGAPGEGENPVENAIAVARFTDGAFGWGVKEPGHGLVFASAARPLDAPASALLSASGDYGPLLLLEGPSAVPHALSSYLSDIQPAYGREPQYQPVHGAYNHGWLIGDERAISATTQAEIDSMLEISPSKAPSEPSKPASEEFSEPPGE